MEKERNYTSKIHYQSMDSVAADIFSLLYCYPNYAVCTIRSQL